MGYPWPCLSEKAISRGSLLVYGRIKFEGGSDGNFLVRRNIMGFSNTGEGRLIRQVGYFKPNDSGYFAHQVRPGKLELRVYEEKTVFNPKLASTSSVDRNHHYKNNLGEIDLKSAGVYYIGNITLKRVPRTIEIIDKKTETDVWFHSKSGIIDSSKSMKRIPF